MKKAFIVGKWEYLEKVRTKTFLISLILTPAIIILFSLMPTFLSDKIDSTTKAIGIIDTSNIYFTWIAKEAEQFKLDDGQPNYILINLSAGFRNAGEIKKRGDSYVLTGRLDGYLLILNGNSDSTKAIYASKNTAITKDIYRMTEAFNLARKDFILSGYGIPASVLNKVHNRVNIIPETIDAEVKQPGNTIKTGENFMYLFFSSYVYIVLLTMMILSSGGMLIRSLVEEKSNRLIEILISSCTPDELLTGKVIGLSSLGITQVAVWLVIGIAAAAAGLIPFQVFNNLLSIFIYFLLGFVFYTSIFVGVGSIVTTEQEAQQITSYLSLILILPIVLTVPAIENPDSFLVHMLSVIPFTIPSIMILRLNIGSVPLLEIFVSALIMLLSIYLIIGISSRIFRIGILAYGKRPSLKELIGWLKTD